MKVTLDGRLRVSVLAGGSASAAQDEPCWHSSHAEQAREQGARERRAGRQRSVNKPRVSSSGVAGTGGRAIRARPRAIERAQWARAVEEFRRCRRRTFRARMPRCTGRRIRWTG